MGSTVHTVVTNPRARRNKRERRDIDGWVRVSASISREELPNLTTAEMLTRLNIPLSLMKVNCSCAIGKCECDRDFEETSRVIDANVLAARGVSQVDEDAGAVAPIVDATQRETHASSSFFQAVALCILVACAALTGCASLKGQEARQYCGKVEGLSVYVADGTLMSCPLALEQVKLSVSRLAIEGFAFGQSWDVVYTWRFVGLGEDGRPVWGMTHARERLTLVRVFYQDHVFRQGPATTHELAHVADLMTRGFSERE